MASNRPAVPRLDPLRRAALAYGPKMATPLRDFLTIPEQETVLTALSRETTLRGQRDYALIAVGLMAGLRCGELAELGLDRVDIAAGVLRVVNGKGGKSREVPVPPRLVTILRAYLATVRPVLTQDQDSPFFFVRAPHPSPYGGQRVSWSQRCAGLPLERRSVWWIVEHAVSPLVGRHVHPHCLRHSTLRLGG